MVRVKQHFAWRDIYTINIDFGYDVNEEEHKVKSNISKLFNFYVKCGFNNVL